MVKAPRITEPRFGQLQDSDGALLVASEQYEGERYAALQLTDRDLTDAAFHECQFSGVTLDDTQMRGIRFVTVEMTNLNAPVLNAPHSEWRDVAITQSRVGAGEFYDADLSGVLIEGCKLGYLNFRGATLRDVLLSECTIDELDLGQTKAARVTIRDCRIGTLDVTAAQLSDVDLRGSEFQAINGVPGLRGATIDDVQLAALAPVLAEQAGLLLG